MHKKFEINLTKIKGGCQSGRKVVTHNSKCDLPLKTTKKIFWKTSKNGPLCYMYHVVRTDGYRGKAKKCQNLGYVESHIIKTMTTKTTSNVAII